MPIPSDPYTQLLIHASTRGLGEQEVREIAQHAEIVRFEEGDVVLQPDDPLEALYLVSAGRLKTSIVLPGGVEKTISYVGRDEQIGVLALLQEESLQLKVVAEQPSILMRIPRQDALRLLHESPLWGRNLLKALGPQLRKAIIGSKAQVRKRVIVLIHSSQQSRNLTADLVQQLTFLGEKVGLGSDCDDTLSAETMYSMSLLDSAGDALPASQIRDQVASWSDADRVILDLNISSAARHLVDLLVASEATYWLCASDRTDDVVRELKPILKQSPRLREKIFAIRMLSEHEQVAPLAPDLREVCADEFKYHWNGCKIDSYACTQRAGLQRILHHLRGVSVGLALGGGAARGMAHLGVLQVIQEAGITIDRMSGTSAGALAGVPFAAGYTADFLINAFSTDLKPGSIYQMLPYGDAIYALLKYRRGGWDPMLRKYLHDWRLEQLALPFSSVTVDLVAAEPVIRHDGDASTAVLESINLPGIARPICSNGQALVDGGVLDVVPADVVVNQGANLVISSDVSAKISFEFYGNRPDTPTEKMKRPSGTASLIRMRTVQDRNIRAMGGSAADIVIEPDVSTVELTDFKNADKIARLGRTAAEEALPELKRILHEMDAPLFPL